MAYNNNDNQAMDDAALATLPKRVFIRGDNAEYLRGRDYDGNYLLVFNTPNPGPNPTRFEIHPAQNGMVRIKSTFFGTFWRCNAKLNNYVHCTGNHLPDHDTMFYLVQLNEGPLKSYAIKSVQLNLYLTRITTGGDLGQVMRAQSSHIVPNGTFQLIDITNFNNSSTEEAAQLEKEAQAN